nr:retrovirus-related Pol polyprotein from transposon TNT 1-94 [Tanacetum cinerariifolium]
LGEPANYKAALLDPESKKWLDAMNVEMQSIKDNDVWVLVELPPNARTVGSKWLFKKKTDMDGAVYIFKARLVAKGFTQTYEIDYEETFSPVADIRAIRILIAIAAYYDYELKLSKSQGASTPAEKQRMQNIPYASAVGSIMYAVRCTRPDVAFAQNVTSRFQQNPGEEHWIADKNILKYLRDTKDMFLVYGGNMERELRVSCYTDAEYLTDAENLKSQTGYMFVLNGGIVDWKSTKQSIFANSSTDAEYIAAFNASKEAVWIHKFISGLGIVPTIEEPINTKAGNRLAYSRDKIELVFDKDVKYLNADEDDYHPGDEYVGMHLFRYLAFERHLEKIYVTYAHLEKKRTRLQTYANISQDYVLSGWRRRHKIHALENQFLSVSLLICLEKHDCVERIPSDENHIRTFGDYSKPSHEGYRNTNELPVGNNVVPLRSDTVRLVKNGCSFHELRSEDPNQHLKHFLKLVDSLDLKGSITTWEDLTTRFLAQFFPSGRTAKLRNDILMFQQHHGESLSEA